MKNPFLTNGYLYAYASLNKLVIEKIPETFEEKDIRGKSAQEIFSSKVFIQTIKNNLKELKIETEYLEDAQLPYYFELALESFDSEVKNHAISLINLLGRRLGLILLTLKQGDEINRVKREDWEAEHWEYWQQIETIILVGGLANETYGKYLKQCIKEVFRREKEEIQIVLAENPSEAAIKGLVKYITIKKEPQFHLTFDMGQSYLKRSILLLNHKGIQYEMQLPKIKAEYVQWDVEDCEEEFKLAQQLTKYIEENILFDIWYTDQHQYSMETEMVSSIANYIIDGKIANRGGYGKLRLIAENYEEYLEELLRNRTGRSFKITMVHDGTAMAAAFSQYEKAACVSLGTVFGVGFPKEGEK